MVAINSMVGDERLAGENHRLRELLKQWVRLERGLPAKADLYRLIETTKRALLRDDPEWAEFE